MQYFDMIAIFIAPIFGLLILNEKYKYQVNELILNYLNIFLLSNLLTNIILYIFKNYSYLHFSPSFFIKYSISNIIISVFIALFEIILKENVKVKLVINKNEKK
ncbi:MAG: hypothetical protein PHS24_02275 [Bacilli bacterium]|nr:hypothetical protein [Bacilli bacterium]